MIERMTFTTFTSKIELGDGKKVTVFECSGAIELGNDGVVIRKFATTSRALNAPDARQLVMMALEKWVDENKQEVENIINNQLTKFYEDKQRKLL